MPTFSADYCLRKLGRNQEMGISILDDLGKLKPETFDVLGVVKEYGLILCTGHLSPNEIYVLAREALRLGIEKILVTHPCAVKVGPTLSLTQQKELGNGVLYGALFYSHYAYE